MATTKNITMKQFNGTDYDTLYPKTVAAQIVGAVPIASGGTNGTTASSGVNNLVAGLSQITPASNDLFPFRDISGNTGGSVTLSNLAVALGDNGVITPSNLAAQASALGFAKIQSGSYVGTGGVGSNNPCSLTFDSPPKYIILTSDYIDNSSERLVVPFEYNTDSANFIDCSILSSVYLKYWGFSYFHYDQSYCKKENNSVYWYNTNNVKAQCNVQGVVYHFIAFL